MPKLVASQTALAALLALPFLCPPLQAQDTVRAISAGKPGGAFSSPAVDAGDYVYISGQGPRKPDGSTPGAFSDQVRQALDNVQVIVKSAGLTLDHVVYMQIYMEDTGKYDELKKTVSAYFGKSQPAQAVLGVAKTPYSALEINAVAVRKLDGKKPVYPANQSADDGPPAGMLTYDRLFVSSMPGADPSIGKVPQDPAAQ